MREENRSTRRKTVGGRLNSTETQPTYDLRAEGYTWVAGMEDTVPLSRPGSPMFGMYIDVMKEMLHVDPNE